MHVLRKKITQKSKILIQPNAVSAVPKTKVFEHVQIRAIEAGFSTSVRTGGMSVRNKNQGGNPEETGRPT
jgi:hypothetical protein